MGKPGSLTPVGPGQGKGPPPGSPRLGLAPYSSGGLMPRPNKQRRGCSPNNPEGYEVSARALSRDEDSSAHSGLSTQRMRLRCSRQDGKPGTPQHVAGLWSQLSCLSSKPQKGLCVRGPQGPVPLSLPELPTGSQDQEVPEDRAGPPLRTGVEERVTKGPP